MSQGKKVIWEKCNLKDNIKLVFSKKKYFCDFDRVGFGQKLMAWPHERIVGCIVLQSRRISWVINRLSASQEEICSKETKCKSGVGLKGFCE